MVRSAARSHSRRAFHLAEPLQRTFPGEHALNSTWDWQFFLKDTGDGRTYFEWLISAWGWTLSVAVLRAGRRARRSAR